MRHGQRHHLRSIEIAEITIEAMTLGEDSIGSVERQLRGDERWHRMPAVLQVDTWSRMVSSQDEGGRLESLDPRQDGVKGLQGRDLFVKEP